MPTLAILWRSALGATIALTVGLACTVLWAATPVAPMAGMSEHAAPIATVAAGVAEEFSSASPAMAPMCGNPCVSDTSSVACTGVGVILTSLLVLFLAFRRNTFMGLLTRVRRPGLTRRRLRERTPWVVLSPVSLCVFRV
ncbi:hypothetical protein GCM10027020_02950 [Nocardioides salsibiostraticola]